MAVCWELFACFGLLATLGGLYFANRKRPVSLYKKHIVVTGGSSGIGLSIAAECIQRGADVTIIARNEVILDAAACALDLLRQVPEQRVQYQVLDIGGSYDKVEKTFKEIEEEFGPIYMLVNCAGMCVCGTLEEISVEDSQKMMNVNYFGTYNCTRYVLPRMKAAGEGVIVLTASQAALVGIYGYGPYAASKFALRGLAETINMEASHFGVSVTLALPADTDTPGFAQEQKSKPKETNIISGSGGLAKPDQVAKKIVDDALNGSFFSVLGLESWVNTLLCCGMAPWGGVGMNILQAIVMGPLRIIGCLVQWHFYRVVKQCANEKKLA